LKLERVSEALRQLGKRRLRTSDRQALVDTIYAEGPALGLTREANDDRPSVLDEVESAQYYYRRSLLVAVPRLMRYVQQALATHSGEDTRPPGALEPIVGFRSWIGGDRDGNPYVTPEVTREAYELQTRVALGRYLEDMDLLVQRLSQHEDRVVQTGVFREDLAALDERYGSSARFPHEPFRRKLEHMYRFLNAELDGTDPYPDGPDGYVDDLRLVENTLASTHGERLAETFVRPARYRADAFGFVLAPLDLREHSSKHEIAVADLLAYAGVADDYVSLPEDERARLLARELSTPRPLAPSWLQLGEEATRALDSLRVLREVKER